MCLKILVFFSTFETAMTLCATVPRKEVRRKPLKYFPETSKISGIFFVQTCRLSQAGVKELEKGGIVVSGKVQSHRWQVA